MNSLIAKVVAGFVTSLIAHSACVFLAAGSLDFWEGWIFLQVFFIPQLLIGIYFLRKDPDLIKRRLKSGEKRIRQKVIMALVKLFLLLLVFVPGLDHRFRWSYVPAVLVITADVVVLIGFLIQFHVFKENTFASVVIAVVPKQTVISTEPYAVVRHPMYSGVVLQSFFVSIALGSWWGLPFGLAIPILLILRLLDEEKLLHQSLAGYDEYCQKVPYRLIPQIW
jgi:protein-S-isoprenylcysteine O-methyltransferase Ste14